VLKPNEQFSTTGVFAFVHMEENAQICEGSVYKAVKREGQAHKERAGGSSSFAAKLARR
jgi:hypothetical protein